MYKYFFVLFFLIWGFNFSYGSSGNAGNHPAVNANKVVNSGVLSNNFNGKHINSTSSVLVSSTSSIDNNARYLFYIGTYTGNGSQGIYKASINTQTGEITTPELAATISNPSFQSISGNHKLLWSVTETGSGSVTGFSIDTTTGNLTKLSTFNTNGDAPCYVSFDNTSNSVVVANYNSGNVSLIPVTADGIANGQLYSDQHKGNGPVGFRQSGPHAHCAKIDPTGRYVYSCDLGTDKIYVYSISAKALQLVKTINAAPGSGPRHLDFHPKLKSMAVIHELDGTITTYLPDADGCFSIENNTVSALPDGYKGPISCADIHYSNDGKFLYGSNRGHNSIVLLSVDEATQKIKPVDWLTHSIKTPRNFSIEPSGNFLLVANQDGNCITEYKIDKQSGMLTYTGISVNISNPVCLTFLKILTK